jgi:ammonia channel protein AmtB
MEVLLNATLAGGVVMGASCDLITGPGFAMIAGAIAGAISALGFLKLNRILKEKINLHDTCGVTFLHCIPGTLGGFVSVICAASVSYNFGPQIQQELIIKSLSKRDDQKQAAY